MQDVHTQAGILRTRCFLAMMAVAASTTAACGSAGGSPTTPPANTAAPAATPQSSRELSSATPSPAIVGVAAENLAAGAPAVRIGMVVDASVDGGNRFTPAAVTVHVGQVVEWGGYDQNSLDGHNVIFPDDDSLSTPRVAFGQKPNGSPGLLTWQVRFTTPGTYNYVCTFHLPGMTGTITVLP